MAVELIGEWLGTLIEALEADAGLRTVCGHASGVRMVWEGRPGVAQFKLPCVSVSCDSDNPLPNMAGVESRPNLSIECVGKEKKDCREIYGYLHDNWTIPERNGDQLLSTHFRLSLLYPTQVLNPVPFRRVDGGEMVYLLPTLWNARITRIG